VIDASIAHSAGGIDIVHPVGRQCREFLERVRGICHRMAWGPKIEEEWNRHLSTFSATWLATMNNLRKLRWVDDSPSEELIQSIEQASREAGVIEIMRKDAHLLTAALRTDARITALDDAARNHFGRCLKGNLGIAALIWVNPLNAAEDAIDWLDRGAPIEAARQLGHIG